MQILQYVHQHYNENLTLKEIARVFFINPAYLGRMFQQQMGMSFSEYLLAYRMQKAMTLLKSKDIKVMDVARAVGYSNMNYFYRVFHEHTGVTPSQYRVDSQKLVSGTALADMGLALPEVKDTRPEGRVVCRVGNLPDVMGEMVRLRSGALRYYYPAPNGEGAVMMSVDSMDDGTVWSQPGEAALPESIDGLCAMSVLRMLDGSIGLFIFRASEERSPEMLCMRSYDDGDTWSARPERLRLPVGYGLQSARILRLSTGRLVIPFTRRVIERDLVDRHQIVCHYLSDDDGLTWRACRNYVILNCRHTDTGLCWPTLMESRDGMLRGWAATDLGRQYEYSSMDGGETWTSPTPSHITSGVVPMSVCGVGDGRLMAVCDPVPDYETRSGREKRLVYLLSRSEDRGWSRAVILEESPDGSLPVCEPTAYPQPDGVLLAYRAGEGETVLRRISARALAEVVK